MTHSKTIRLLAAAFGLSAFLSASVYGEEAPSSPPDTTAARARMNAYLQDLRKADNLEQREQALAKHWKDLPPQVRQEEHAINALLKNEHAHSGGPQFIKEAPPRADGKPMLSNRPASINKSK